MSETLEKAPADNNSAITFNSSTALEMGVVLAAVTAIYLYFGTFVELWNGWNRQNDDAGYGMLVPGFAVIFVMLKWQTLKRTLVKPTMWGLLLVLLGILMRTGAELGQVAFVKYLALVVLLGGVLWTVVGHRMFRQLLFPVAFLVLMMPIPAFLYRRMAVPMMNLAAKAGFYLMKMCSVDVTRSGNVLHVPQYQSMQVADACSGMKSLLVLFAVAIAFGYITKRGLINRVIISVSAIPIAIIMNALRVGGVGVLAVYVSPELAEGMLHMAQGFLFFLFELVILFCEGALIGWILGRPTIEMTEEPLAERTASGKDRKSLLGAALAFMRRMWKEKVRPLSAGAWKGLRGTRIRDLPSIVSRLGRLFWTDIIMGLSVQVKTCVVMLLAFGVVLHFFHESVEARTAPVDLRISFEKFASDGMATHPNYNPGDPNNSRFSATEDGKTRLDKDFVGKRGIPGWIGFWETISVGILKAADNDDYLNIRYYRYGKDERPEDVTRQSHNVLAYVSYHGSAANGINSGAIHYPDECYPANGYDSIGSEIRTIKIEGYCGGEIDVICYIYRGKNTTMVDSDSWIMVVYHMNNNGRAVVDRTSGKIFNWWKLVTGERVGFLAQVQLNTGIGVMPRGFDPDNPKDEKQKIKYEQSKNQAWERLEQVGALFLKKLGRHLPEPARN